MLTREQGLAVFDFAQGRLLPDRLTRATHAQYVDYARQMLELYRGGCGRTRQELHRGVADILAAEEDCPVRRVAAFAKLLDDASEFTRDRTGAAARLRQEVFRRAARFHPLVQAPDRLFEHGELAVKTQIAAELGTTWEELDSRLFADVIEFHRLERFPGYPDPVALLSRYNVAQVQTALYGAVSLTIWATGDLKTILRYAKLARLLHTIHRHPDGSWQIRLDGPASVLRETQRYGVLLAKFLPALIACRGWRMVATVPVGRSGWRLRLLLSEQDGLRSHLPPPDEFDSEVEEAFARRWGPDPREGWMLRREDDVLVAGQTAFFPDFTFEHADGRRVHLEIVGFWTPEYLTAKAATLERFAEHRVLVAVAQSLTDALPPLPDPPLVYKTRLKVEDVVERLRAVPGPAIMRPSPEHGETGNEG